MRFWEKRRIPGNPRIGFGIASYLNADERRGAALRCMIGSLQAQSWTNWRALVIHDGPLTIDPDGETMRFVDEVRREPRVQFLQTGERRKQYGHPWRQQALETLAADCEWIVLTNEDNYYVPAFAEWMLSAGTGTPGCQMVYCDTVHSHQQWAYHTTEPRLGQVDLGAVMVHRDLALRVPFDNYGFKGDGHWVNGLVAASAPVAPSKVAAAIFVHN